MLAQLSPEVYCSQLPAPVCFSAAGKGPSPPPCPALCPSAWQEGGKGPLAWLSPSWVWGSCQGMAAARLGVQSPLVLQVLESEVLLSPCRWDPHMGGQPLPGHWSPVDRGHLCSGVQPCALFQTSGGNPGSFFPAVISVFCCGDQACCWKHPPGWVVWDGAGPWG